MNDEKIVCWEILQETPIHAIIRTSPNGKDDAEAEKLSTAIAAFEKEFRSRSFQYLPFAMEKRNSSEGSVSVLCAVFAIER